jgi:adenine-specific DNA-methyltransferase
MTADTSRVALALTRQRLMTAVFDYYHLMHPTEGVGSGFRYEVAKHITLESIANNEKPHEQTLFYRPLIDPKRSRVTGPFTVEAVPAPVVKPIDEIEAEGPDASTGTAVARTGETQRQAE